MWMRRWMREFRDALPGEERQQIAAAGIRDDGWHPKMRLLFLSVQIHDNDKLLPWLISSEGGVALIGFARNQLIPQLEAEGLPKEGGGVVGPPEGQLTR